MKTTGKLNYGGYSRKSSEAEDKQALSIDSQIDELKKLAASKKIVLRDEDIMQEAHSAKSAFARPVFELLIKHIEQRKVQGLLVWHPNRLSRNAVDAARLIQLMDEGKLVEIVTPSQTFHDTPQDKFFFTLMTSQAKMENDAKGIDVKRGLRKKNEMGYPAGVAKLGYVNDYGEKGYRKLEADPERFELVKQLLLMFLSGKHSARALLKHSTNVMRLHTIQRKKEGGRPIQLSRIYTMLQDPFYAGFFWAKDENRETKRYEVNEAVPRMITEAQYWEIQTMLGRNGIPRPTLNKDSFPYAGRTRCGNCNGTVIAEHKHQLICPNCRNKFAYKNKEVCPRCDTRIDRMENATYLHYIYYHCNKGKNPTCEEPSIQQSGIDESMAKRIEQELETSRALSEWCIQHLEIIAGEERKNEYERKEGLKRELAQKEKESEELIRMRMKGLIEDDDEFLRYKEGLESDKRRIKQVLDDMGGTDTASLEEAKKAFAVIVGLSAVFKSGTFEEKQEALSVLGSNLTLKEKNLNVINKKVFLLISKGLLEARAKNPTFEPRNYEADKDETEAFASVRPTLLRDQDSNLEPTPYT
ncbi:MAG TPA: recombinase family protein [Candidatus Paceibacterota bacterium]|nr:recombinase family protein [Candidatus Paceibacterota bacterium]